MLDDGGGVGKWHVRVGIMNPRLERRARQIGGPSRDYGANGSGELEECKKWRQCERKCVYTVVMTKSKLDTD